MKKGDLAESTVLSFLFGANVSQVVPHKASIVIMVYIH